MQITTNHLRDEELLSFADGELGPAQVSIVEQHLAACWQCRTRRSELEGVIANFIRQHNQNLDAHIPPADGPRSLLKARLTEAVTRSTPSWLERLQFVFSRGHIVYAVVAASLILIGLGFWRYSTSLRHNRSLETKSLYEPRPELTPGAVRPVSLMDICRAGVSEKNRIVSVAIQREVFNNYGIADARPQDYEVDYLITPELGGADDIKNLWPQPFAAKNWGAYTKDDLEDRLHGLVCSGKLDLSTAQQAIAKDWIGAYQKYVQTSNPVVGRSEKLEADTPIVIAKLVSLE